MSEFKCQMFRQDRFFDFSPALAGRNSGHLNLSKTTSCLDEIGILNLDIILLIDAEKD
jgi:hypothetical protein